MENQEEFKMLNTVVSLYNPFPETWDVVFGGQIIKQIQPNKMTNVTLHIAELTGKYMIDRLITENEKGWEIITAPNGVPQRVESNGASLIYDPALREKYRKTIFLDETEGQVKTKTVVDLEKEKTVALNSTEESGAFGAALEDDDLSTNDEKREEYLEMVKSDLIALATEKNLNISPSMNKTQIVDVLLESE